MPNLTNHCTWSAVIVFVPAKSICTWLGQFTSFAGILYNTWRKRDDSDSFISRCKTMAHGNNVMNTETGAEIREAGRGRERGYHQQVFYDHTFFSSTWESILEFKWGLLFYLQLWIHSVIFLILPREKIFSNETCDYYLHCISYNLSKTLPWDPAVSNTTN